MDWTLAAGLQERRWSNYCLMQGQTHGKKNIGLPNEADEQNPQ